jgi:hypothetical protein
MTDAWNIYLAAGRGFETPTMKKNRKLCLSLKRRANCKIARLRAGQI